MICKGFQKHLNLYVLYTGVYGALLMFVMYGRHFKCGTHCDIRTIYEEAKKAAVHEEFEKAFKYMYLSKKRILIKHKLLPILYNSLNYITNDT